MKAFVFALVILVLTIGLCTANDLYCHSVCDDITAGVLSNTEEGASAALEKFRKNEFLLKCSVDNGYVIEAKVSLESLIAAYAHSDGYEIQRYVYDTDVRVERIRKSLYI